MKVPYLDLAHQFALVEDVASQAVLAVLKSGNYVLGEAGDAFEQQFAAYIGSRHAVGVSNGTDGLRLALQAIGVGPGDEVVLPLHTFKATLAAVRSVGATPVLVDSSPQTGAPTVSALVSAVGDATKAIIPVHMHGHPYPVDQLLRELSDAGRTVAVIEDASQAHGAVIAGRRAGSLGTVGVFSLYPGKNLGAAGDGGICVTDSDEVAHRLRSLRTWSDVEPLGVPQGLSWNCRLDEVQAAVLSCKLPHLDSWNDQRREQAMYYRDVLPPSIVWPGPVDGAVYHHFICLVSDRDAVRAHLASREVETGCHYPVALSRTMLAQGASFPIGSGHADAIAGQTISLPIGPHLTQAQLRVVASELLSAIDSP